MLIHESAHYFISIKRGYKCTCIVLSAFGAVLYGNFEQLSDDDEIKISLAGPISNLIIVVILIALWWVFPQSYIWTIDAVYANVSIGVINMLPAYPLDGGRILTAKLSKKMSRNRALNISILIARGVAILVFVLFIVSCFIKPNFTIGIFAIFLYSGNFSIVEQNVYKKLIFCDIEPKLNRGLEIKTIAISNKTKLYAINSKINTSCYLVLNI
ncbi:MAG: site-2 protease family protein, partial [Clostridia bacterium]